MDNVIYIFGNRMCIDQSYSKQTSEQEFLYRSKLSYTTVVMLLLVIRVLSQSNQMWSNQHIISRSVKDLEERKKTNSALAVP